MINVRKGVAHRPVTRLGKPGHADDEVVVEEPLEIRVAGDTMAVTMRTPGDDRFLAVGFLYAEGVIGSRRDLGSIAHCGRPGDEGYGNTMDVIPAAGVNLDIEKLSATRRGTLTTAACGVCGRRSVDDVIERCSRLPPGARLSAAQGVGAVRRARGPPPPPPRRRSAAGRAGGGRLSRTLPATTRSTRPWASCSSRARCPRRGT